MPSADAVARKARTEVKRIRREQRERDLAAKILALPDKRYGVLYVDAALRWEPYSRVTGMDRSYATSELEQIKAIDVASIAAPNCMLFIWATAPMLPQVLEIMAAWGFTYKSRAMWVKEVHGHGYWFWGQHELLLVGTRGKVPCPAPGTQWPSIITERRIAHSVKPERAYEPIESYFPNVPKIELFARRARRLGFLGRRGTGGGSGGVTNMLNLNRANLSIDPLNESINARIEQASLLKHASDVPRDYLGASLIGEICLRKIQFEWLTSATFSARVRSIFARGHYFEAESREQLREAGFVFAHAEALGFVVAGGPIAGHADGIILAVPDDINLLTPALWEHKALNAKNFRAVERDGLAKVFPRYAGQVAIYQHFLEVFNPALMTIVNGDTCERLHFTVLFDPRLAQETIDRAVDVVRATRSGELLQRLDPDLKDFRCGMCSHLNRCQRYE